MENNRGELETTRSEAAGEMTPPRIGGMIRELRKTRRMTVVELARTIGRSVGYVSQSERDISTLSITALSRVAEALDVPITWFFQGQARAPDDERDIIVRATNRRRLDLAAKGFVEEILSPSLAGQILMVRTTIEPGMWSGGRQRHRKGEEAGLVLEGELELHIGDQRYHLDAGDSFSLLPGGRNRIRNPGPIDAVVVWVIAPAIAY